MNEALFYSSIAKKTNVPSQRFMISPNSTQQIRSQQTDENNSQQKNNLKNEINSLKWEIHLWNHTFFEIVNLFKDIIPIAEETAMNSIDKQNTLLKICRDVAKTHGIPINTSPIRREKSPVPNKFKKKPKKPKEDNNFLKNFYIQQLAESQIPSRLQNIDKILSKEIKKNKKYIPPQTAIDQIKEQELQGKKSQTPQRKKEVKIFPAYSTLLSPNFHDLIKNKQALDVDSKNNIRSSAECDLQNKDPSLETKITDENNYDQRAKNKCQKIRFNANKT